MFDFGEGLRVLRQGGRITRRGWNGRGMFIELQPVDEHSKMTLPYIFMQTARGDLVPWLASQTDLLSGDWSVAGHEVDDAVQPCPACDGLGVTPYVNPLVGGTDRGG